MYSQAGQDAFVIEMTGEKKRGKFLEFGAFHPINGSNTIVLEKDLQWSGVSIDNGVAWADNLDLLWKQNRPNTNFFLCDAFDFDFSKLDDHYDYLQIDIDTPYNCLALLKKVLEYCEFSLITFEHDSWTGTNEAYFARDESRKILQSLGYDIVVNDVSIKDENQNPIFFEDWYANPKFISSQKIETYTWIDYSGEPKYWQQILKC